MAASGVRGRNLANMFDPEVIEMLREQFTEADADNSGEIDAEEACTLFARFCAAGSSPAEIQRTANSLRNQMDSDRNGKISFEEYAFRFGRKLQMEVARRRREGLPLKFTPTAASSYNPPASTAGLHQRKVTGSEETQRMAAPPPPTPQNVSTSSAPSTQSGGADSRAWLYPLIIGVVMLAIFLVAVFLPAPENNTMGGSSRTGGGSYKQKGHSGGAKGKSRGR